MIIEYRRVPTSSAADDGIQIIQTIYADAKEIDQIEEMCKENIRTALLINPKEKTEWKKKVEVWLLLICFLSHLLFWNCAV